MPKADDPDLAAGTFESIAAALGETPQGRAFLAEHARRARADDTTRMLDAIARLEQQVSGRFESDEVGRLQDDISELTRTIQRTKRHIAELSHGPDRLGRLDDVSQALGAIVRTTEQATSDILDAAERIQETAWTMRESGLDPSLCDAIDARATDIYSACVVQDLTAQRVGHVVDSLAFLEERLRVLSQAWGIAPPPAERPPLERRKLYMTQSDIDFVIVEQEETQECAATRPVSPAEVPVEDGPPGTYEGFASLEVARTQPGESQDEEFGGSWSDAGQIEVHDRPRASDEHEATLAKLAALEATDPRARLRLFS